MWHSALIHQSRWILKTFILLTKKNIYITEYIDIVLYRLYIDDYIYVHVRYNWNIVESGVKHHKPNLHVHVWRENVVCIGRPKCMYMYIWIYAIVV